MFNHVELNLPQLQRETIDGVRYYKVGSGDTLKKLASITSVTSNYKKEFFNQWRKKVGVEKADAITRKATSRGTDMHTLVEHHLKNEDLPTVQPLSQQLFYLAKPTLNLINFLIVKFSLLFLLNSSIAFFTDKSGFITHF